MVTAPQTFRRQLNDHKKKDIGPQVVEFSLATVDDEGQVVQSDEFHSTKPSDEQLFLIAAMAGDEDASATADAAATLALFRESLPDAEYRVLRSRLKDPDSDVDLEMLAEVVPWLMQEWSSFPTEPSSASSASPPKTGGNSTGRVRGKGSTHSV